MKGFSDFIDFSAEEFASDESFQSFVAGQREDDILFWGNFAAAHPEKLPELQEAREILSILRFRNLRVKRDLRKSELNRLLVSLPDDRTKRRFGPWAFSLRLSGLRSPISFPVPLGRLAASSLAIILVGLGLFFAAPLLNPSRIEYKTAYGETVSLVLPDGSSVTLNGNSRLTHKAGWNNGAAREVWLDGEGFFEVKRSAKSGSRLFVVHTSGLDVEVLGTKFNVFNRKDEERVVLNSGSVRVRVRSAKDTAAIVLIPDESLQFSRKDHSVTRKRVKSDAATSWRNHKLIFERTPLRVIGEMITDIFGYEVIFHENVDAKEELTGTLPSENLEMLLDVLAKTSDLSITRSKTRILIAKEARKTPNQQP